ncbi:MAG: AIM24 family protein, partial [Acidobacteria bacterium]|nr:AIM24 family protein [Acidobacteriota bacterium]
VGFFGGEGFILQKLRGDGMAFLHAGGTVVERQLQNEKLRIDTGCIVAFTPGLDYSIERAGNLKSMFFGGEGFFLATISGTGTVWLQSLPFSRLADRIIAHAPRAGGSRKGEGSVLGALGNLMGD